jgi:hypothetical protein
MPRQQQGQVPLLHGGIEDDQQRQIEGIRFIDAISA